MYKIKIELKRNIKHLNVFSIYVELLIVINYSILLVIIKNNIFNNY